MSSETLRLVPGADCQWTEWNQPDFSGQTLTAVDFCGASLRKLTATHADFSHCRFLLADLKQAVLRGSNLRSVNFRGACLFQADLTQTCLCGSDFSGADLYGADLRGADLTGVRFSRTLIMTGMKITHYQAVLALLSGQLTQAHVAVMEVSDSDS